MTQDEIDKALECINRPCEIDNLTTAEIKMFLSYYTQKEVIESQGWKLRSNGYNTWWEMECPTRGRLRVWPHWVSQMIDDARISGELSIVNVNRSLSGLQPMKLEKYRGTK